MLGYLWLSVYLAHVTPKSKLIGLFIMDFFLQSSICGSALSFFLTISLKKTPRLLVRNVRASLRLVGSDTSVLLNIESSHVGQSQLSSIDKPHSSIKEYGQQLRTMSAISFCSRPSLLFETFQTH